MHVQAENSSGLNKALLRNAKFWTMVALFFLMSFINTILDRCRNFILACAFLVIFNI